MNPDFGEEATRYAQDVVDGKIIACKWHRLACKRHLADMERAAAGDWQYVFNPVLTDSKGKEYRPAQRICLFAERMPHIKGEWAARGELIKLERWQTFILAVGFGWVNKETGLRRFQYIDLIVPRKNTKSTIGAVIGLFMLAADDEFGAEVYSGATNKSQAFEVFRPALLMARATAEYRSFYGVVPNSSNLAIQDTNSKFEPVIGKPGDGASPSCAIVDEYHEHATDDLYDTMETGMVARLQPLMLVITTAGANIGGPCYQHQVQLQKILEGTEPNDRRFGIIFTIDNEDQWATEDALRMANPNYGISVLPERVLAAQRAALTDPRKQSTFKTKHLNIWVASASPWLNLENLQKCGDPTLKLEDFVGETATAGLDLASKVDIASRVLEFRREIDGETHYYVFSKNYLPRSALDKAENAHYRGWAEKGFIEVTPGNMINLRQIEEDLLADAEFYTMNEIALDAWGAREMAPNLQEAGYTVIDVPMNVKYLSEPMKDIAALIDAGRFHHDGNEAFVWMMSNVEIKPDRNDNIFPRKQSDERKIDGGVATIVSHSRAMLGVTDEGAGIGIVAL